MIKSEKGFTAMKSSEKRVSGYVIKFSAEHQLECEVRKNGASPNEIIEININTTEKTHKS